MLSLALGAGLARAERLAVRPYGIEDGLAGDSINAITQDSRGYVWFATSDGLSRFDGQRFTSYGRATGLPQARINAVLETREGVYWVATRGGLARFIPDHPPNQPAFERVPLGTANPKDSPEPVFALFQDSAGAVWAGSAGHLFKLSGGKGSPPKVEEVSLSAAAAAGAVAVGNILSMAETADRSLWIGTQRGLLRRLPDGRIIPYPVRPHYGEDPVRSLAVDRAGHLWIVHALQVFVLKPGPAEPASRPAAPRRALADEIDAPGGCVIELDRLATLPQAPGAVCLVGDIDQVGWRAAFVARDDSVWLASSGGLFLWDGRRLKVWTEDNGLTEASLTAVTVDRDGNLWLGTESRGAMRLARDGFVGFSTRDGLGHPQIHSIFEGADGGLYVHDGSTFEGRQWLNRFDGTRFTAVQLKLPGVSYLGWSVRQSAFQDRFGGWWVATGEGLARFKAGTRFAGLGTASATLLTVAQGLGGDSVRGFFEDSRGDVWVGTNGERTLSRWSRGGGGGGRIEAFGPADGLPPGSPTAFAEDSAGQIWIGYSGGGLVRRRQDRPDRPFERFGAAQGVPAGPVTDLHFDRSGRLWISTEGGGAGRLDAPSAGEPQLMAYTTAKGLSSDDVLCIADDPFGRIYLGGAKGLDRLDPATGRIEHFTTADGLPSNRIESSWTDRDGNLWLGTRRGVSRLKPVRESRSAVPQPWITAVRIDGVSQRVSELGEPRVEVLDLQSGTSRVEIEFLALSFAPGRRLTYQYRLEGIDDEWIWADSSRSVKFPSLPTGSRRFLVRAVDPDTQVASTAPAEVLLSVHPPLWRRAWFLGLLALITGAGGYFAYRYRVAHIMAVGKAVEQMRSHLATDLHDDLGASLSRISILSEVARRRVEKDVEGARLVSEIGEAAREMIESLGENIWAIDPRRDQLRSLITRIRRFAGDLLEARGMAWSLQTPPEPEQVKLSPLERRHLYLIFKEALNNVARHSDAKTVVMTITLSGRRLSAMIRDDGKGFTPPVVTETVGRHGLPSMGGRAAQLGGELKIESKPGQGTEIRMDVPLSGGNA